MVLLSLSYLIVSIGNNNPQQVMAQKRQNTTTLTKKGSNETWLTYQNSTLGVKIQYPSSWIEVEGCNNLVKFFPPEIKSGSIHAFIQARVVNIPTSLQNKVSLEQYTQRELNQLGKSFTITGSNATTITANHNPARTVLYGAEDFKGLKTWTIYHGRIYLITYAAITEKYPIYLPTVQKMINSFDIIK
jgi:eukaryotic-like serine/threonine-protein kinase